jgi:hypothetical protein
MQKNVAIWSSIYSHSTLSAKNRYPVVLYAHTAMIVELPTKPFFRITLQIYLLMETCMCKYARSVMIKERTCTRPKAPKPRAWAGDRVNHNNFYPGMGGLWRKTPR